jgi:hypothetical protein
MQTGEPAIDAIGHLREHTIKQAERRKAQADCHQMYGGYLSDICLSFI